MTGRWFAILRTGGLLALVGVALNLIGAAELDGQFPGADGQAFEGLLELDAVAVIQEGQGAELHAIALEQPLADHAAAIDEGAGGLPEGRLSPVKATSAAILGRTGDVRWVPMLHRGLSFGEAVVVKACRLAIKALVKRFRAMKDRLKQYVYHVDLKGMREKTGLNDNLLTTHFQEQMLLKLHDVGGFEFGKEMDLRDDAIGALVGKLHKKLWPHVR